MTSVLKNIIVLLGLVLIAGLGYYLYTQNISLNTSGDNIAVTNQSAAETEVFLRRLNDLKQIDLNTKLFTDSRFTSLTSYATDVPVLFVGRGNPFKKIE